MNKDFLNNLETLDAIQNKFQEILLQSEQIIKSNLVGAILQKPDQILLIVTSIQISLWKRSFPKQRIQQILDQIQLIIDNNLKETEAQVRQAIGSNSQATEAQVLQVINSNLHTANTQVCQIINSNIVENDQLIEQIVKEIQSRFGWILEAINQNLYLSRSNWQFINLIKKIHQENSFAILPLLEEFSEILARIVQIVQGNLDLIDQNPEFGEILNQIVQIVQGNLDLIDQNPEFGEILNQIPYILNAYLEAIGLSLNNFSDLCVEFIRNFGDSLRLSFATPIEDNYTNVIYISEEIYSRFTKFFGAEKYPISEFLKL
jgi:hypothetical protein